MCVYTRHMLPYQTVISQERQLTVMTLTAGHAFKGLRLTGDEDFRLRWGDYQTEEIGMATNYVVENDFCSY